ncbi:hypothetical protein BDZ45DRAFT_736302 [Acephala macrosclerotiorum]|nr:hypothetical protein BDZ45DRAFT_736302 [Acephala macrosclerotiorum]
MSLVVPQPNLFSLFRRKMQESMIEAIPINDKAKCTSKTKQNKRTTPRPHLDYSFIIYIPRSITATTNIDVFLDLVQGHYQQGHLEDRPRLRPSKNANKLFRMTSWGMRSGRWTSSIANAMAAEYNHLVRVVVLNKLLFGSLDNVVDADLEI